MPLEVIRPAETVAFGRSGFITPFGATEFWDCVDEAVSDSDTTYIRCEDSPEHFVTVTVAGQAGGVTEHSHINQIEVFAVAREEIASLADPSIVLSIQKGGTYVVLTSQIINSTDYTLFQGTHLTDPTTGQRWVTSEVLSASGLMAWQLRVNQNGGIVESRITQSWLEVSYETPKFTRAIDSGFGTGG